MKDAETTVTVTTTERARWNGERRVSSYAVTHARLGMAAICVLETWGFCPLMKQEGRVTYLGRVVETQGVRLGRVGHFLKLANRRKGAPKPNKANEMLSVEFDLDWSFSLTFDL